MFLTDAPVLDELFRLTKMADVFKWLESLGFGQYAGAFEENAVDWEVLPELNHELLRELGVTAVGHRVRILKGEPIAA